MKQKSLANPEVYISKNTIYDEFAKAEDHQKKIEKFCAHCKFDYSQYENNIYI